jgi:ankyrin repeat protein
LREIQKKRQRIINIGDGDGNTPLLIATAMSRRELVEILLQSGADISSCSKEGNTPLSVANDPCIVSLLQKKLVSRMRKNQTSTFNLTSSSFKIDSTNGTMHVSKDATSQLLKTCGNSSGFYLQLQDLNKKRLDFSQSVLSLAIESGFSDPAVLENLLSSGADVRSVDAMGRTPLHECISLVGRIQATETFQVDSAVSNIFKLRAVAETLLNAGADVMAKSVSGRTPLHELFCKGQDVNFAIVAKRSPMRPSIAQRTVARVKSLLVRTLLHWGADPLSPDRQGYAPVHYCCKENMPNSLIEMLKVNSKLPCYACPRGRTALHVSCIYGSEDTAEVICKWDADRRDGVQRATDNSGKIPRDYMCPGMDPLAMVTIWQAARSGNSLRYDEDIRTRSFISFVWPTFTIFSIIG